MVKNNTSKWVCKGNDYRKLPDEIIAMGHDVFIHPDSFTKAIDLLTSLDSAAFYRLPVIQNTEPLAYGSHETLINQMYQIKDYRYRDLSEVSIQRGNLKNTPEIQCILSYIAQHKDKAMMLDIEGPFTILASLVGAEKLFLYQRKKPELLRTLLLQIAEDLADYAKEAISCGIRLISFSDPQSSIDLVGKKFYENFNGKAILHFMKEMEDSLTDAVLHICGKTSFGLIQTGMVTIQKIEVEKKNYRQHLFDATQNPQLSFLGNACINQLDLDTSVLFQLTPTA